MKELSKAQIAGGQQIRFSHESKVVGCTMNCQIYLPPQAEKGKVPVLYWLSGLTSTDENFVLKAGAQRYAAECGLAIVAADTSPRGEGVPTSDDGDEMLGQGAGFYVNATEAPWAKNYQMYDYVVEELPALIAAEFAVEPELQSISGFSMGGHGALVIALRNPERYRSVSALSPITSPAQSAWGKKALQHYLGKDEAAWAAYDSCELIRKAGAAQRFDILIDQGADDEFISDHLHPELLEKACADSGYPLYYNLREGYNHSYYFVSSFIGQHIRFHKYQLRRRKAA